MMNKNKLFVLAGLLGLATAGCSLVANKSTPNDSQSESSKNAFVPDLDIWPRLDIAVKPDAEIEQKVKTLLAEMTLEQKVAQMIQPEIRDISVEDMRRYGFGSFLNGGGAFPQNNKHATPADWIKLAEDMYQASIDDSLDGSTIPSMWGTDAVHGHNNVIGATLFPHNIGLGAANNPALIEAIAEITATEVMVTGIDWVFAPTVAVVRDDRWGRTYEGYSEDPEIVRNYAASIVKGLQGHATKDFLADNRVISTVKHFVGDGGTQGGDDQGNNVASEQALFDIHAQGYVGGLSAGAQSVMASFNSWHGEKVHGNQYLLTQVLKERMGFDGFVVGDWNGHGQIKGCSNDNCPQAVNAGLDIYMVPTDTWKPLYENTIAQVKSGVIPMSRIDDAVSRILRVKFRAGLFDKPSPAQRPFSGKTELIGHVKHREVARRAVRESLVLLKNKNDLLPLDPSLNVLVAGDGADNIGKQSGGWSITWQGTGNKNQDFPGGTSIYQGLAEQINSAGGKATLSPDGSFSQQPDVAIVVFGEEPYAEGHGDLDNLEYQRGDKRDLAMLQRLKAQGIPVVSVFISGRPLWVNAELNASDAFVAAWLPGSEGQGVADVLLKSHDGKVQYDFTGRLSFSWPKNPEQSSVNRFDEDYAPLLPYGFGLSYGDSDVLPDDLNEKAGTKADTLVAQTLFNGKAEKPWVLYLASGEQQMEVSASAHQLNALNYRTVDRLVQEDAFRMTLTGVTESGVFLASQGHFREDLRSHLEAKSALSFLIRFDQSPKVPVHVSMRCGEEVKPNCGASLDLAPHLTGLEIQVWHEVSVDLKCFADKGMSFGDVIVPFELKTKSNGMLELAEIALRPKLANQATLSCH